MKLNHGIELSEDSNTLYASSAEAVYSWPYDPRKGSVGDTNKTLIANMSNSDHTTRTLLLSRKSPGTLLVSRGSDSNQDGAARELASGHSQLKAFETEPLNGESLPYDFPSSGSLLGWGLRNSVGIAEHPVTGGIFTVENSVDRLSRNGVDIHQNNPGEELNFHGTLGQWSPTQGENYGYPDCYALWTTEHFPNLDNLQTGDQFAANSSKDSTCREKCVSPRLTFQAHMAPLDILFTGDGGQAFVTFHGSWNRDEPTGYKLSVINFESGQPQALSNSTDSTRDILTNRNISACPDKCFRPVGLAWDRSGRLWMSSDSTGEIYVLAQANLTINSTSPTSFAMKRTPNHGYTSLAAALTALLPLFATWL